MQLLTLEHLSTIVVAALGLIAASVAVAHQDLDENLDFEASSNPIVIGHRGASGYRPEHTLASYSVAIRQGADFIEPDLVATGDGHLIARHENELGSTTDVAEHPEFAERETTKVIDGVEVTGWFSEDFTLAEIKTLRARERIPEVRPENSRFDGRFEIPTLEEVIGLVKRMQAITGRKVGIYPETKHPTFFAKEGAFLDGTPINLSLGQMLIDTLVAEGFTDPERVFIQSFEFENLIELHDEIMPAAGVDLPLVQLYGDITLPPLDSFGSPYDMVFNAAQGADFQSIYGELAGIVDIKQTTGYGDLISQVVFNHLADAYAEGIGPFKDTFLLRATLDEPVDTDGDGVAEVTTRLTGDVHPYLAQAFDAGLLVHPYTLRAEEVFLTLHPNGLPQTVVGETQQLLGLGVHGLFIDQPNLGVRGRDLFLRINDAQP